MATFLDTGLVSSFSSIFSMLLIVVLIYGILEYSQFFGKRQGLHMLVALLLGMLLLVFPSVNEVIRYITPWFVLMFIFIILMLIAYKMLGATDSDIKSAISHNKSIIYWVLIFSVIILLGSLGRVFFSGGDNTVGITVNNSAVQTNTDVGNVGTGALMATIFHPKVLGLIFLLLIGVFTITTLTGSMSKD